MFISIAFLFFLWRFLHIVSKCRDREWEWIWWFAGHVWHDLIATWLAWLEEWLVRGIIQSSLYPNAPWCWYIYLHNWVILGVNVGKYSSTMVRIWDRPIALFSCSWNMTHDIKWLVLLDINIIHKAWRSAMTVNVFFFLCWWLGDGAIGIVSTTKKHAFLASFFWWDMILSGFCCYCPEVWHLGMLALSVTVSTLVEKRSMAWKASMFVEDLPRRDAQFLSMFPAIVFCFRFPTSHGATTSQHPNFRFGMSIL